MESIDRLDLLILKAHIVIEHRLAHVLATRLGTEASHITTLRLGFEKLAKLALARNEERDFLSHILSFAKVRDRIAHRMETSEYLGDFASLSHRVMPQIQWPRESGRQLQLCRFMFTFLLFQLNRAQYGLPVEPFDPRMWPGGG
ncbi:MAG: hypothetical protein ACYC9N_20820 [Thermoanaerobaculia bacterium]